MIKKFPLLLLIIVFNITFSVSQSTNTKLIKADKLFIKLAYANAAKAYEDFLKKNAKDFYASRQVAICYTKINNPAKAIDFWPSVIENSQATDADKLAYAQCLLANYRPDEAKKILSTLKNSSDKNAANWAIAFDNSNLFYEDSALCKVFDIKKGINTNNPEYSPVVYDKELIYVTEHKKSAIQRFFSSNPNQNSYRFNFSVRKDTLRFDKPTVYNDYIQCKKINGPLCFTPDDSSLYFTRSASKKDMKKAKIKNAPSKLQIYFTRLNQFGDAHPEILPFIYNSPDYDIMHPSFSADGKTLYFASNMSGSIGGLDIFMCKFDKGEWGSPQNLGPQINTTGNEFFPHISPQGILYFASDTRPGLGGLDIFFADPNTTTKTFYEAENIGAPMNTQFDDFGVYISKSGKVGYLSSNRKSNYNNSDIFYFVNNKPKSFDVKLNFIDSLTQKGVNTSFTLTTPNASFNQKVDSISFFTMRIKPTKQFNVIASANNYKLNTTTKTIQVNDTVVSILMALKSEKSIKGKVIDKETNLPIAGVKVAIYDEFGNKYLDYITDSTGVYKVTNLPLDKPLFIGSEKRPDYFSNTEKFVIKPDSDLIKNIYTQKIVIGKAIKIDNIYFDLGKFNIRPDAAIELDKIVQLMKNNSQIIIELSSHTDCRGVATTNLTLSDKRAKSSTAYIISKGIDKSRIKGKGYGEGKLLNNCGCEGKKPSTCSEEEHAQNRRTEFKVTGFIAEKKAVEEKPKTKKAKK